MSFYLGWLIKKVSGVLPFDMVYGFVGPCFPAVDLISKDWREFSPSLSQKRQPSNLCSWFPRKQALFGEHWFPGRRRLGWGPEMSRVGERLEARQGTVGSLVGEGSTQSPGGDETWRGSWAQGCCQGQRHQAAQFESNCHTVWPGEETVQLQNLPAVQRPK